MSCKTVGGQGDVGWLVVIRWSEETISISFCLPPPSNAFGWKKKLANECSFIFSGVTKIWLQNVLKAQASEKPICFFWHLKDNQNDHSMAILHKSLLLIEKKNNYLLMLTVINLVLSNTVIFKLVTYLKQALIDIQK